MDRRGTPASRRRRPATSTFTTWAPPVATVATPRTTQAVAPPTASAHTAMAAQGEHRSGKHGDDDPDDTRGDRQANEDQSEVAHRDLGCVGAHGKPVGASAGSSDLSGSSAAVSRRDPPVASPALKTVHSPGTPLSSWRPSG
jgi:hypothetical protein